MVFQEVLVFHGDITVVDVLRYVFDLDRFVDDLVHLGDNFAVRIVNNGVRRVLEHRRVDLRVFFLRDRLKAVDLLIGFDAAVDAGDEHKKKDSLEDIADEPADLLAAGEFAPLFPDLLFLLFLLASASGGFFRLGRFFDRSGFFHCGNDRFLDRSRLLRNNARLLGRSRFLRYDRIFGHDGFLRDSRLFRHHRLFRDDLLFYCRFDFLLGFLGVLRSAILLCRLLFCHCFSITVFL